MSIGSYWWPCTTLCNASLFSNCSMWKHSDLGPPGPPYKNCTPQTGLPWYDHDGYANPINTNLDAPRFKTMASTVQTLALAYFFFNDVEAGERAAMIARTWFLNPSTRMNPNAWYAQGIPGRCDGRDIGIIDFESDLPMLLDSMKLARSAGSPAKIFPAAVTLSEPPSLSPRGG